MKLFPIPLLLLWLVPIVIAKLTFDHVPTSPDWFRNYQTLPRFFLEDETTPFTFEAAPDALIPTLSAFGVNR
jgi:hypothetical protein